MSSQRSAFSNDIQWVEANDHEKPVDKQMKQSEAMLKRACTLINTE
jgi:hypothetical protein